ncbi:MAG: hypothetical protein R2794_12720 [Chitinophagales bacterium]
MLQVLQNHEIDKTLWDNTIRASGHNRPYALSSYLDAVSPGWAAIIAADYTQVMPLPYHTKFGMRYVYQPALCQQMGVYGTETENSAQVAAFLEQAARFSPLIEIAVNSENRIPGKKGLTILRMQVNQSLSLQATYKDLQKKYSVSNKKNVIKAARSGSYIEQTHDASEVIAQIEHIYQPPEKRSRARACIAARALLDQRSLPAYSTYMAYNRTKKNIAGLLLFQFDHCLIPMTFSTVEGRKCAAVFALLDHIIEKYAQRDTTLNFLGSAVPGIQYRNAGFGAVSEQYPFISMRRLPVTLFKA